MKTYTTAQVAQMIGIHPNTVRLYERWGLIPKAARKANRYRVFTDLHLEQLRLARLAFQIEITQNGLRKRIVELVKASAVGDYDRALTLAQGYLLQVRQEARNAKEAIEIAEQLAQGSAQCGRRSYKRWEVSQLLNISMDTLRNWEMNGLLLVKRRENGYRIYTEEDIRRLKMIRCLRCANYSLASILRMLSALSENPGTDMDRALNAPQADGDIISACDRLAVSLQAAQRNAVQLISMLKNMRDRF